MNSRHKRPILVLAILFLCGAASAQEKTAAIHVHSSPISQLPISIGNFTNNPPDITLVPHGAGARSGHLWINTAYDRQLYIVGKVDGGQPEFPRNKMQMLTMDHVEIWLAANTDIDLPKIGWGDQFGDVTLPEGEDSCGEWAKQIGDAGDGEKKCRDWAVKQARYRPYLKRLFLRQWLVTPDYAVESYATPAYEEIQKQFSGLGDKIPEILKPRGVVQMYLFPEQSGYSFEIVIPFEALPPLPSLRPGDFYLEVDVFKAAPPGKKMGDYSASSSARVYGKPETFNLLRLEPPLFFSLTPCDLPLTGTDKREGYHPAWFIPAGGPVPRYESDVFIIVNDPAGYRYEPAGLSPTVRTTHYFWQSAGPGEWVCGPHLTYRKGNQSASFPYTLNPDGFETKRFPGGQLLVKTGPRVWFSEFGSGQCGACSRTDLRVIGLNRDMNINAVLTLGEVINTPRLFSQDFTVSQDWSRITEFDLQGNEENLPGSWSSTSWCLKQDSKTLVYAYEKCGEKEDVQPPDPPILKELRDYED
jgi:hypothetical protein